MPTPRRKPIQTTHPRYLSGLIKKLKERQIQIEGARKHSITRSKKSLVVAGPSVNMLVHNLKGGTLLERLSSLAHVVARIPIYEVPDSVLMKHYANRSAEAILRSNAVFRARAGKEAPPIYGCVDHAHILVAALRAMKLPAKFVRWGNHSMARFSFEGREYFLDVDRILQKRGSPVRVIEGDEARAVEMLKKEHLYKEGRDARELGLDYFHFNQNKLPD